MATLRNLPPRVSILAESLRDLGYSLETAVADLLDNSISAGATEIQIFCDMGRKSPVLVIADNGAGMTGDEVVAAMRYGSKDPREQRSPADLGRFGLGLKTASFSQCRRLTVASLKGGRKAAVEWDLDRIEKENDWIVSLLDRKEIAALPYVELLEESGTLVIWQVLDRLFEDEDASDGEEIVTQKLAALEKHLALVFHRFLAGEFRGRPKLSISLNGGKIKAFDPFCRKNEATQLLPRETLYVDDVQVLLQPYVLPHHSRLTASEYDYYQDRSDFISNQGAYIYRNGRLMAWGDWFRLVPKGESTKLVRVQIDFPNSLDEAWTIDIRKSRAHPPYAVRERLRNLIDRITVRGENVYKGRGQKLYQETKAPLWERYADRDGIRYSISTTHPLVAALSERLAAKDRKSLEVLIRSLSSSLPIEMLYADYSSSPREFSPASKDQAELKDTLRRLKEAIFGAISPDPQAFREVALSTRLFEGAPDLVEQFIKEELT